jgi:hypothetical protein
MAFRVKSTDTAKQEVREILAWLREFPARCAIAPENEVFEVEIRQLIYGRKPHQYRILFNIEADIVWILHIRHGRRDRVTH